MYCNKGLNYTISCGYKVQINKFGGELMEINLQFTMS